jgi:hypothetical protein
LQNAGREIEHRLQPQKESPGEPGADWTILLVLVSGSPMNRSTSRGSGAAISISTPISWRHGPRFVYNQSSSHQLLAVASVNRSHGRSIIVDLHKPKTAGLSREAVTHDSHGIDCNSLICKEILQIGFIRGVGEIAYEKLLH